MPRSPVHFSSSVLAPQPVILTPGENGSGVGPEKVFLMNWVLGLYRHSEWCSHVGLREEWRLGKLGWGRSARKSYLLFLTHSLQLKSLNVSLTPGWSTSASASSVQSRWCLVTAETNNSSYLALVCISHWLKCFSVCIFISGNLRPLLTRKCIFFTPLRECLKSWLAACLAAFLLLDSTAPVSHSWSVHPRCIFLVCKATFFFSC